MCSWRRCATVGRTGSRVWPLAMLLFWWCCGGSQVSLAAAGNGSRLEVVGAVQDSTGRGIAGVQVKVELPGQPLAAAGEEPLLTDDQGRFQGTFFLTAGTAPPQEVELQAGKPSWQTASVRLRLTPAPLAGSAASSYQAMGRLTLSRQVTPALWLAAAILLGVLVLTALGWLHRALAALLGAALMLFLSYTIGQFSSDYFIISFSEAIAALDMNVILLLLGMMLVAGVTRKTGLFQWLAYQSFTWVRGQISILVLLVMWVTALISALLDNVTTMLFMMPVAIELATILKINPVSLLIPEVFAANVGGTATLIGDPANMIIGSAANLTFGAFVTHLTPVILICLAATVGYFLLYFRQVYTQASKTGAAVSAAPPYYRLSNRRLLCLCLIMLALMIIFFCLQDLLGMKPAVAAIMGAVVLVAVSRVNIADLLLSDIQWPSLLFILALYIVVAGAAATGLLELLAQQLQHLARGNLTLAVLQVLWISGLASAFIDTIPLTVIMLPIVSFLNAALPGTEGGILWWALALGAGLGGTGTLMGASANLVTAGLAERAGCPISFLDYLRAGFPPMLITIGICSLYLLWLR